jgi:hypothetical protein
MTTKFLRREKARKCPVHTAVGEKAIDYLVKAGAFCRQTVLDELDLDSMSDSIRWDYVREFIEEDQGCELIPVSALFFKAPWSKDRKESPMDVKPEKYLASGHGKRTAGYASVTPDAHAKLVLKRLEQKRGLTNGVGRAFTGFVDALRLRGSAEVQAALPAPAVKSRKRIAA